MTDEKNYDIHFVSAAHERAVEKSRRKVRQRKTSLLSKKRKAESSFSGGYGVMIQLNQHRVICRLDYDCFAERDENSPIVLVRFRRDPKLYRSERKRANRAVRRTNESYQNGEYRKVYDYQRSVS